MHRPIRSIVALFVATAVSLAPTLAFGAGGAPTPDRAEPSTASSGAADSGGTAPETPSAAAGSDDEETQGADSEADASAAAPVEAGTTDDEPIDVAERERDTVRLGCELRSVDDGRGIGCKWSGASSSAAAGYLLWRAVDVPNPRDHRRIVARGGLDFVANLDTNVSAGHVYHYAVEIVDARGRTLGWSDTVRVSLIGDEALRFGCSAVDGDRGTGLLCEWSQSEHPRFAGYQLIRSNGDERTTVFETRDAGTTRFFDEDVRRGVRYTYAVRVLDRNGATVGTGGPSTVGLRSVADEKLRFGCELTTDGDQRGVACTWDDASHPDARGYVLYRSVDGAARQELFQTGVEGPNRFFDTRVEQGHRYRYVLVLLDGRGSVIGSGDPVTVAIPRPQPAPTPTEPRPVDPRPVDPRPEPTEPQRPADAERPTDRPGTADPARPGSGR